MVDYQTSKQSTKKQCKTDTGSQAGIMKNQFNSIEFIRSGTILKLRIEAKAK